ELLGHVCPVKVSRQRHDRADAQRLEDDDHHRTLLREVAGGHYLVLRAGVTLRQQPGGVLLPVVVGDDERLLGAQHLLEHHRARRQLGHSDATFSRSPGNLASSASISAAARSSADGRNLYSTPNFWASALTRSRNSSWCFSRSAFSALEYACRFLVASSP